MTTRTVDRKDYLMLTPRTEYRRVAHWTLEGHAEAERLQRQGWTMLEVGPLTILLSRTVRPRT